MTVSSSAAQAPMPGLPAAQLLNRSSHGWLALSIPSFGLTGREKEQVGEVAYE